MQELLEVHVGTFSPAAWDERERDKTPLGILTRGVRPRIGAEAVAWTDLGLEPRWVGEDTSTAVAALEATDRGADEWRRYFAGAEARSELALFVTTAEPPSDAPPVVLPGYPMMKRPRSRNVDFPYLGFDHFHIAGEPLSLARPPALADGLSATDKDLALRIRNERPPEQEWIAFEPAVYHLIRGDGSGESDGRFIGTWTPLLLTPDGRTVAGVWSDDRYMTVPVRHYVLPDMPSYEPILRWLVERAVPDLIPTAAARTRRHIDLQPNLQTARERELTDELAALTERYETAKADLEDQLAQARAAASSVRDVMLFGTGPALEAAVARVLTDAGLGVEQLDEELGTVSGDLLVEHDGHRVLVEVKSVGGNAPERLTEALHRHRQTWPQLRPDQPLTGALLIVNHQHKLPPADRSTAVYQRQAFVDSLEHPVVSTLELFDAWRREDWAAIHTAIGLTPAAPTPSSRTTAQATSSKSTGKARTGWRWPRGTRSGQPSSPRIWQQQLPE